MSGYEQGSTGQKRTGGYNNRGVNQGNRNIEERKKERVVTEENYVEEAEKVIKEIGYNRDLTTSKLRNLLALSSDIYNMVMQQNKDVLTEEVKSRIEYLKVRFIYEAGRDENGIKRLVENANLLGVLKNIKGSKKNYILFNRYMEALVAFHRYYGGDD